MPHGSNRLLEGDRVYLIGKPEAVLDAEDMFSTKREARRVAIIGGGAIGSALIARLLPFETKILLIEKDRRVAEARSAEFSDITVVHGDGTDLETLREEEVGSYDLVAAVTQHDEVNLMAALLARKLEASRVACVVDRADYVDIYRQLGIDVALSPRVVASDRILRYARGSQIKNLTSLENGQAEVVELRPSPDAAVVDVPLKDLTLPPGVLLAAIVRGDRVIVPHGKNRVMDGDTVVVLTTRAARTSTEQLFGCVTKR